MSASSINAATTRPVQYCDHCPALNAATPVPAPVRDIVLPVDPSPPSRFRSALIGAAVPVALATLFAGVHVFNNGLPADPESIRTFLIMSGGGVIGGAAFGGILQHSSEAMGAWISRFAMKGAPITGR